ncbi:MAG: histidine phosphatase family protein [Sphingomonadaceae bacterium]|nr:histidine phosphatase family protein [Sphingomonadaceae bacterium]
MSFLRSLLLAALIAFAAAAPAAAQDAVYVMRHLNTPAGQADPDLLPEGQRAAEALAAWFRDERPVAIYVTDYKRTRETVAPLAARLGLTPIVYDPRDTPGLVARIRAGHGPVLVVGHSNTVPEVIAALGGTPPAQLGHEDFGDIWRVAPGGATTRMRIEGR